MVRETRHLWVGNLPETVREDRIRDHFKRSTEDVSPPNFEQRGTTYYDRNSRLVSETEQYIRRPNNYHTGDIRGRARDRLYRNGPYSSIIERTPPVGHHRVPSWYDTSPSGTSTVSGGQAASPASRSVYGNVASAVVQPDTSSYDCQLIKKKKSRSGSESPCGGSGSINAASSHSSHLVDRGNGGSAASSRSHSRSPSSCSSTNSTSSNSHASSPVSGSDPPLSSSSSRTRNLQSAVSAPSQSGGLSINNQSSSTNTGSSSSSSTGNPVVHSEDNRPLAICVRNLPARSSDTSLKDGLFHEYKKHGKVTWVKVVGQNAERYALVCFKKPDDVEKALEVSHDKLFFGCKIEVAPYQGYDVEDNEFRPYEAELDEYHPKSTRTLFIGNLEKDITGSELRKHFDCFGEIIEIDIKKQGMNAYAFCQYSDIVSVVKAMRKMDGEHLGNNRIKLGFGKSMPTNCVWIDGIADSVSENHLMVQFSRYGSVSQVVIDRERKLALVSFDQIQYAQTAVKEMRGATLRGRKLQVDFASRECQEAFYEKLEKQSSGNGSNSTEISNSSVATETTTTNRVVSVPGARFSRYDSTQTRSRASSFSRHTSVNSSGNTSPNNAPAGSGGGSAVASATAPATPAIVATGGTTPRGGRSRSLRHGDYEYPERRFRSYDEYSQGSGASHDDESYTNYASTRDQRSDSPQSRLGPIPGSTVDTLEVSNTNSGRRRCDKSPGDIRNLQKERFHLLEQLEECPSSGDELVSPKKRMKFDHTSHHHNHHHTISGLQSQQQQPQQPQQQSHQVDGSNSSNNSNSIHQTNLSIGDSNCDVLNNHSNESGALHHRKCVEVRRLSECSSLKYATTQLPSSRRPSTESGSMISGNALRHGNHEHNMTTTTVYAAPHSVSCKRRRTSNVPGTSTISGNSTETSEYHTSRGRGHQLHSHHSHEASGGESADGSRPGTPLCDERPEVLPSEPRRIPRDKPHEPMMLPLPKFGIQFFQQNRTSTPAAGAPSSSLHAGQMYSVSSSSTNININNSSSNNLLNSSSSSTLLNSSSSHSSLSNTLSSPPLLAGTRLSSSFHHPTQQMASHHHLALHATQPSHHQPQSVHHHHHHHHHSQSQQQQHHHHHLTASGGSSSLMGGIEQPPASPIRARSLSSNSSDSDMAPISTSPSLEERIKWLDEKFEIWSGGGNVAGRPHSLSSESTQHSTSFSSRHKFLDLDVNEVKPSEIVKSVLAKKSIFDDDLQRLKNISDKYEPGDFSNLSRSSLISSTSPGIPNLAATKTPVVGGTSTTKPSSQSTVFTSPGVNQLQRLNSSPMNSPQAMSPYNSPSPSPVVTSASVKVSLSQQNLVTPQPAKGLQYPFPSHPPVVTPPTTVIQPTVTTAIGSSTSATQPVTSAPQTQSKTVTETISASRPKTSTISKSFSVPGEKTSSSSGSSLSLSQGVPTQSSGRVLCKSASIPGSTNVGTVKSATSTGTSSLPTNYSNTTSTKFDEDSEATGSEHNFRRSSADSTSSKSAYQKSTTTNTSKKGDKAHKHNHRNDSDRKLNKNEKSRSESIDKRKSSHSEDTPEVNDLHSKDEDRIEEDRKKKEQEEKENAERERQERLNKERQEREKTEKEKQKQDKERLERERREKERRREREEREEKERKDREERERKDREERERRERDERDRKEREERERREREERERKDREERERKEREEQERREREKEEQERREKEERDRRDREERDRREREEAERKDREERERKERERKDVEERVKRDREQKEESERLRREEETRQEEARQKDLSDRLRLEEKETSPASSSSNKHNREDHDHEKAAARDRKDDEHTHFSHSHHSTNKDDKHNKENSENLFNDDTQNLRDVKGSGNSPIRLNKRRLSSQDSVENDEQIKRMRISGENRKLFDRKEGKDSNRSKHHKSHGRASSLSKNSEDKQTNQDERYRKDSGFEEKKNKDKEHKKYDRSDKSSASAQKYKKQHSSTKDDKEITTNLARDEEMSPSETLPMFDTSEIRSTDDDDHQTQEHQHQQRHKTKKEHKEKKRHDQDDDSSTHRQSQHNNRNDSKRHDNNRHSDRKGSTRSEEGSRQASEKSRSKPMPRKLTQSSNDSDSDEPKKHSIFDILDDGPYISMYDKVKARSCKNMQKQEEEKKIKAKFTQLKQSRAKREEKKRSTSYDGDSDSDFDDRHTKYKSSYKLNRSSGFINSSSDEGTVMRQRDSIISDSDSDVRRAQYNRARLNELCDGDSSDGSILNHSKPPCKKISSKRNSRSTRIASDSSDNEVPLPRMEIEDREKLDNMEMKFKAEIKNENQERDLQIEKKSESFPTVKIEKIKIEPSENLSPIKMEVKAEIKDSITDFYSTQHEDSDNNACSGSAVESKDSIFDQLFSPESRKKHKKSKKRQKSSPLLADNETSIEKFDDTLTEKLTPTSLEQVFDELKRESMMSTTVPCSTSTIQFSSEKKKHKDRKEKKREKTREEYDKSAVSKEERHRLKKSKKSSKNEVNRYSFNLKRSGEKMEDIFGPISDDESQMSGNEPIQKDTATTHLFDTPVHTQQPVVSAAINPYKQEPLTPKSHTVEENEENKQKASSHLERERHRKEKREKKRKEREKSREQHALAALQQKNEDENSVDLDEAGRALEAQLMEDSDNKLTEETTPSTATTHKSDMTDVFRFSDGDENSMEVIQHEKKETQEPHKTKEKKKKKKRSKEERHQRREHHHHSSSHNNSLMSPPPSTGKLSIEITSESEGPKQALCKPSPSLPCLLDDDSSPPLNKSSSDLNLSISPMTREKTIISPIPKTPTLSTPKSVECKKKPDKFIPGFDVELDEKISESAVKSISAEFTSPIIDPIPEDPKIPIESPPDSKVIDKIEEKSRVIISQEETEDAVAALLGESFGTSSAADYSFTDDPCDVHVEEDLSAQVPVEPVIPEEDAEEMRKAVQSLSNEEIEIKADTPQSEHDLQIDTDTEEPEEDVNNQLRFDNPPKTPDVHSAQLKQLPSSKTSKGDLAASESQVKVKETVENKKTESADSSNTTSVITKNLEVSIPTKEKITKENIPETKPAEKAKELEVKVDAQKSDITPSVSVTSTPEVSTPPIIATPQIVTTPPSSRPQMVYSTSQQRTSQQIPAQTQIQGATQVKLPISRPQTHYVMQPPTISIPEQTHFVYPPINVMVSPRSTNEQRMQSPRLQQPQPQGGQQPSQSPQFVNVRVQSPHSPSMHRSQPTVMRSQSQLSPVLPQHVVLQQRQLMSPPGSVSTQPGSNTITSTNSPNIILNRMPVTSVLAPISKPIQPQNIILPQPNTAQTSIANKADSPHTQHPESKEIKVTGQTITYQSTRVSTPTPSSTSSPVHIGPQNQQSSLQISSPKITHAPAAIIQQQQTMQSPIKSIGEPSTPNHMAHGQSAHLQHIIPVQVQPQHKGQPHQTVVLQQQQIQQQGKQHIQQPPQRLSQQMQQMSKLAQHQQQIMQHQHQIMQQRQQQMQMQQQQQHQQQHQQQKQLQQQLHQQQIHQQQHAQQQHAQIVHMQKVQQQKQQQHQQMQQQHQQMQQQQHVQGQHRVVHQQVLQIHQYPQAQSGGKDSPHKGITSPPSIIQTIPHKDAQSPPVHSRIQQNVVIVRQQPGGIVQQPGIAQQQSTVVQQQQRTLETQQQQSIVHHTPPTQQQQILQKLPQPVPQQPAPLVQQPQPSVQQQQQPQLVTQPQLQPQTQFQQQPQIQQISVPIPSQQGSGQQIMQLNIGVQHQKQVATSPVQSLPQQQSMSKNTLKTTVEVAQINKSPQPKIQIVPQQQQPAVLATHSKPVPEPVVTPIKPPTPVVEIESKSPEEPRGKTPQPVEETPKIVSIPEPKSLPPVKTPEPDKSSEKVEPKEPEAEPEQVTRQECSTKLEPNKEVKETLPSVEQENVSVIKTQAVPTTPAESTEKSMLTEENVTKLSPPEDEIEQDSKEDSDYWSAKELNIESVIKKVDALCSNDEIDEPMPEKSQQKDVEKEQPSEKDSSIQSANVSVESVPETETKSDTPAESTAETEKSEDTHDEEEFEDTQSESADNGKTTRAGKRGRINRNAKKVIVNQQTSTPSPSPASGVVEGVQTRRGKMTQNARGRRGRGAASKVPNTIPTVGEKKMRSHTSDQDVYEFHSDSGEESTTVKTTERPRLILTIKSPGQAVVQTRTIEKQIESTPSSSPAPQALADNTTPPQKESKDEFSTPTVNTRKSRRLQEKDGGNRSTVDDVIEDVVRNSLNSPKAGGQTPPRRSTRNSQNASTTGRTPQPVVNEKQIGPISDIRKSPRANRRTKDRKSSDASADSSDEKGLKVEEKSKPQSLESEEERKVEKIEEIGDTKSPAPSVKPTICAETTVASEKVEKTALITSTSEPSEPMTLIDPVTGVLTVVRQSKEGQYVPVPGAAAALPTIPSAGKIELVQKTVPVAISEPKVLKEEQKVSTPKAPSPSVISSEISKPSTSTTATLPKPTSVVVSTQATPPTTSTPSNIISPSQPQSQPPSQPSTPQPNIPQLPVQQPQQTIRTHPLKAHMLSSQVNKPVVTQGLVKVSGSVLGQTAPVVVNSPTLIKQPGTIVQTSVARNIQHNVSTTPQPCQPQATSSAPQQPTQPHHNLIVNIPPSNSPHTAQVGPPHSPRIQQNVVVKTQQQMPQQQPAPSQQILHVVTKPGGQQQIIAQQPQPQHQSLVIHGNKIQQVPSGYAAVVQGGKIIQQAPSPVTIQTAGKRQTIQVPLAHVQPQQHPHAQKQAGGVSVVTHQVAKRGPTPPTQQHQHHMPPHQPSQQHIPNAMTGKQAQPGLQLASGQAAMVPGSQHIIAHAHQSSHPHQPTGATLLQAKPAHQQQVIPPTKGVVGLHQAPQIMTGAVASPPLKQPHMPSQQPVVTGASSLRASVPSISPQGQSRTHMLQPGLPVPAFEANLHDMGSFNSRTQSPPPAHQQASPITPGEGSFPAGSIRGVPPRDHFIMYQYLRELGAIPSYISRSPLLPGSTEQKELSEVDESMVASPPLELRRPGSGSRTIAVPHSLQSPQDRATDSPQVAQVYVHGTRIPHPHFPDVGARYFDNVRSVPTEPPPAHRPAHSVVAPAPCTYPAQTTGPPATLTHMHPKTLEREREQREREREREKERISIPGHTSIPSHGSLVPAMPAPTGRNIQVATPPHASQVPPQADSLLTLLQRYPVMWQGLLALKTDQAAVQMHFVFGNPEVARGSLPCNSDGSTPPLRIAQRMRLEQTQLEGVAKKMQCENEHCMLLALPCGRDHMDVLQQSRNLQTGFITYLQQKMAAGIVNIPVPGSEQAAYVVHIFPSCDFANENLERAAPDLKHRVAEIAHLLIVIATV